MSTKHRERPLLFILIALLLIYLAGYVYVRANHYLVHRAGYAYGNTDNHSVDMGDQGNGLHTAWRIAEISYWVFTPLRWIETGYWYVRYPPGQPWPY